MAIKFDSRTDGATWNSFDFENILVCTSLVDNISSDFAAKYLRSRAFQGYSLTEAVKNLLLADLAVDCGLNVEDVKEYLPKLDFSEYIKYARGFLARHEGRPLSEYRRYEIVDFSDSLISKNIAVMTGNGYTRDSLPADKIKIKELIFLNNCNESWSEFSNYLNKNYTKEEILEGLEYFNAHALVKEREKLFYKGIEVSDEFLEFTIMNAKTPDEIEKNIGYLSKAKIVNKLNCSNLLVKAAGEISRNYYKPRHSKDAEKIRKEIIAIYDSAISICSENERAWSAEYNFLKGESKFPHILRAFALSKFKEDAKGHGVYLE